MLAAAGPGVVVLVPSKRPAMPLSLAASVVRHGPKVLKRVRHTGLQHGIQPRALGFHLSQVRHFGSQAQRKPMAGKTGLSEAGAVGSFQYDGHNYFLLLVVFCSTSLDREEEVQGPYGSRN